MPALNSRKRVELKTVIFKTAKELRKSNNYFQRKRKAYLKSVLAKDNETMLALEEKVLQRLRAEKDNNARKVAESPEGPMELIRCLRKGIPLPNALRIALLKAKLSEIREKHIKLNPQFRKPEVLRLELKILEEEYTGLKVAFKKARQFGLQEIQQALSKELETRARQIAAYNRLFEQRLVE